MEISSSFFTTGLATFHFIVHYNGVDLASSALDSINVRTVAVAERV